MLDEAVEEHLSAKRLLKDILALKTGDQSLDAKLEVLKEQIEHHVQEEEGELFPRVRAEFDIARPSGAPRDPETERGEDCSS